jgi:hypothetical protein
VRVGISRMMIETGSSAVKADPDSRVAPAG